MDDRVRQRVIMALNNQADDLEAYNRIRCMKNVGILTIFVSIACIIIGILSIAQSAPRYTFPFCLGGAMIAGLSTLLAAFCNIKLYRMYIDNNRYHPEDTQWRWTMVFVGTFMFIALIVGLGISGIWGMVEATDNIKLPDLFPSEEANETAKYGQKNLGYAVATFVLVLILCILKMIAYCACQCYYEAVGVDIGPYARDFNGRIDYDHQRYIRAQRDRRNYMANVGSPTNTSQDINPGDQVITSYDRQAGDRNSLSNYLSGEADQVGPSAPPQNNDTSSSGESFNANNDGEVRSSQAPPPHYDEVVEPPPPSYNDVLEHGGFSVDYV